jgi:hypothetical protein
VHAVILQVVVKDAAAYARILDRGGEDSLLEVGEETEDLNVL